MKIRVTRSGSSEDAGATLWTDGRETTLWCSLASDDDENRPEASFRYQLDDKKQPLTFGQIGQLGYVTIPGSVRRATLTIECAIQGAAAPIVIARHVNFIPGWRPWVAAGMTLGVTLVLAGVAWCFSFVVGKALDQLGSMGYAALTTVGGAILGYLGFAWQKIYRFLLNPAAWVAGVAVAFAAVRLADRTLIPLVNAASEPVTIAAGSDPLAPGQATLVSRTSLAAWCQANVCAKPAVDSGICVEPGACNCPSSIPPTQGGPQQEACERINDGSAAVRRVWGALLGDASVIGCRLPKVHAQFLPEWRSQRSCVAKDVPVQRTPQPDVRVIARPFRSGVKGAPEKNLTIDVFGVPDSGATSHLTLTGEGLVESVVVKSLKNGALLTPLPVDAKGIRSLRGTLQFGDLTVGRLSCTLPDSKSGLGRLLLTRAPTHAARWLVRDSTASGPRAFSAFDLDSPDLSRELFACTSSDAKEYEIELTLADGFRPREWTLELPGDASIHPTAIDVYLSGGRYWGHVACAGSPTNGRYRLAARRIERLPDAAPEKVRLGAAELWRREIASQEHREWFWICEPAGTALTPRLSADLEQPKQTRSLVPNEKDSYVVQAVSLRRCCIDEPTGEFVEDSEACTKPVPATYLAEKRLAGECSRQSVFCN